MYQFLFPCFGLSSAARVFTKLMKASISILRRLKIILIQRQQILEFSIHECLEARVCLSSEVKVELLWWINYLKLTNGKPIVALKHKIINYIAWCLKEGLGAFCQGRKKRDHSTETRPIQQRNRYLPTIMEESEGLTLLSPQSAEWEEFWGKCR